MLCVRMTEENLYKFEGFNVHKKYSIIIQEKQIFEHMCYICKDLNMSIRTVMKDISCSDYVRKTILKNILNGGMLQLNHWCSKI